MEQYLPLPLLENNPLYYAYLHKLENGEFINDGTGIIDESLYQNSMSSEQSFDDFQSIKFIGIKEEDNILVSNKEVVADKGLFECTRLDILLSDMKKIEKIEVYSLSMNSKKRFYDFYCENIRYFTRGKLYFGGINAAHQAEEFNVLNKNSDNKRIRDITSVY